MLLPPRRNENYFVEGRVGLHNVFSVKDIEKSLELIEKNGDKRHARRRALVHWASWLVSSTPEFDILTTPMFLSQSLNAIPMLRETSK